MIPYRFLYLAFHGSKFKFSSPSVYKRPDHGKCYVAQTKQLIDESDNGRKMTKAAKSVVTWDDMAYNYYEDCFTVLVFSSSETATSVTATHNRWGRR